MLKIRLQRIGKRGQAYFKVIVTEHTQKPKGKYLELLGSYDPHKNEIKVDADRVKHWIGQGAHMSATVNNLLVGRNIVEGEKVRVWKPKKKLATGGEATASVTASESPVKPKKQEEQKIEETTEVPSKEKNEEAALATETPVTN